MNFLLLQHLCRGWILPSQGHPKDSLGSNSHPMPLSFPFWQQFSGKGKMCVPAMAIASLEVFHPCPRAVIPKDTNLLWLIGEAGLDTGSSDRPRKVDPYGRKFISLKLWDYFFSLCEGMGE